MLINLEFEYKYDDEKEKLVVTFFFSKQNSRSPLLY